MAEPNQQEVAQPVALPQGYQVGTTVVMPLPAEAAYPLKRLDFLTLCDGTRGNELAGRNLHFGLLISALVGIIGLVSCVDWPKAFADQKWLVLGCFLVLVAIGAISVWGCIHHWRRMEAEDTPYTRLKQAISDFFQAQAAPTS